MFLENESGQLIPIDKVAILTGRSSTTWTAVLANSMGNHQVTVESVFAAQNQLVGIVPTVGPKVLIAAPGRKDYSSEPVIAWGITSSGRVLPVTLNGLNDGEVDNVPVLHTDQTVRRGGLTWTSAKMWLADPDEG